MALKKLDLESKLNALSRREVKPVDLGTEVAEETFAKFSTKVGNVDGEILGGVKSLGKESITPNEVLDASVGKITDAVGVSGLATPSSDANTLSGFSSNTKPKSGILAIGQGGPAGVESATKKAQSLASKTKGEVDSFTSDIGGSAATSQSPKFGDLKDSVKKMTPVSSLSGVAADAKDVVSNETGIGGLNAEVTKPKNSLTTIGSVTALGKKVFNDVTSAVNKFETGVSDFFNDISVSVDRGLGGFLQNVTESITGDSRAYLRNITAGGISLSDEEVKQLLGKVSSKDPRQKTEVINTVVNKSENVTDRAKNLTTDSKATSTQELVDDVTKKGKETGVPDAEVQDLINEINSVNKSLDNLDTTISGSVVVDASLFDTPTPLTSTANRWNGSKTPQDVFTFVASVEELDAEFSTVRRDVTEVIIHATETYSNKNIGSPEINDIHNKLGHDGIGFHYVIRRDGSLQRGRPVNRKGEHAPVNDHNDFSIGIVMVGGLAAASGQENPSRSPHSFTRAQFTTLEQFLESFYRKFPGGQVFGHNDVDIAELDPYFDVPDYVESIFRKTNKTTDPLNTGPLKPSEIS
jgi:N-acetylmuramoyl-L-alanine amidase